MSDVGDTIITGADSNFPASPFRPACPGAPVLPIISYMLSKTNALENLPVTFYGCPKDIKFLVHL